MLPEERFIVQATGPDGRARWITPHRAKGLRTFGPRELAEVLLSWDAAERAIRQIQRSENCADIDFEVQSVVAAPH
jgi:hypothetical protein